MYLPAGKVLFAGDVVFRAGVPCVGEAANRMNACNTYLLMEHEDH